MLKHVLIKGDCHSDFTWMSNGCLDKYNPEETAIIILGDHGLNFYMNSKDTRKKKEVNQRGYRIYCVSGNHEKRISDVEGARVTYDPDVHGDVYIEDEFPNIHYFKMWGIYHILNYAVAVIGGAYSVDKWYRLAREGLMEETNDPKRTFWWSNEQLSQEEMHSAAQELYLREFDFILSHTCPLSYQPMDLFLRAVDQSKVDNSMEKFLEQVKDNTKWGIWCFGHYHDDRIERPHVEMYYHDIEDMDVIWERWKNYDETGHLDWWLKKSPNFYY